ncbi:MAG: hypothetical protein WD342_21385 [Verrucomicrobiales bacterium]
MKTTYNTHVRRLREVRVPRDAARLERLANRTLGREVVLRVRQDGRKVDVPPCGEGELAEALRTRGVAEDRDCEVEVLVRHPATAEDARADDGRDRGDENAVLWNGERGTGERAGGPATPGALRQTPMFFRDNAMNVDLAGLYAGGGGTVFLVLNGPSFTEADREALRATPGATTFGVNNGAQAFRPNLWTCVDAPSRFMRSIWEDAGIQKFVPMEHFRKPIRDRDAETEGGPVAYTREQVRDFPNVLGYRRNHEFRAEQWLWEDTVNWGNHKNRGGGRSVMLAALRLSWLLGFRRVYLLGCDFRMEERRGYWFPEARTPAAVKNNLDSYRIMRGYFDALAPYFEAAGYEIYNCNPESGLEVFPHRPLAEALEDAAVDTAASTAGMYVKGG